MTEYLRVIWRRKWRIVGVALVLAAIVYVRSDSADDEYQAEVLLAATPGSASGGVDAAEAFAASYANLATTRPLVADAVERAEARDTIEAEARTAGFLAVRARGSSPREAEESAVAVADALIARVERAQEEARDTTLGPVVDELASLEQQLGSGGLASDAPIRPALLAKYQELTRAVIEARLATPDRLEVVAPARASTEPVTPTPARDALLTFLTSLVAFAVVAMVIEALSDRLSAERPAEEAARITSLPVLAQVPRSGGADAVEAFRALRTSLMFLSTSERLRTLAVVSVEPGAGKTFIALNLARETAALDLPVVVIDADLRRPSVHERLGIARSPGLSDALTSSSPGEALSPDRTPGHVIDGWMRVIPSGAPVADPAGLFGGRAFRDAVDAMTWADLVVVDTPAAGMFADALAVASQCDATLVVVDAQNTKRRAMRHLTESLRQTSAHPIGLVVNRVEPTPRPSYYDKAAGKRREPTQPATASATS